MQVTVGVLLYSLHTRPDIIGNWTDIDRSFPFGFHGNADASHKNAELNYCGITGITVFFLGTLVLSRSFVQDQVADSSCECEYYAYSAGVKDMEYVRLLIRDLCSCYCCGKWCLNQV